MKELIARLVKMQQEAESIRDEIEKMPNGEILSSGMWAIRGDVNDVIGALMCAGLTEGTIQFNPPEVRP